jgi:ketosteroid isomerase-like protein
MELVPKKPVEAPMKVRLLFALVGLALSVALLTYAQQKDVADPQTTQKLLAGTKAYAEAANNRDAAATAAFFTRDAVFFTPGETIIGREAIQKWYIDLYQVFYPKNTINKVDGNVFHLMGTAGNELWATGELGTDLQDKYGESPPFSPFEVRWLSIYVREGDDWKIRAGAWNITPDTLLFILKTLKSLAQQPAATPSPTTTPTSPLDARSAYYLVGHQSVKAQVPWKRGEFNILDSWKVGEDILAVDIPVLGTRGKEISVTYLGPVADYNALLARNLNDEDAHALSAYYVRGDQSLWVYLFIPWIERPWWIKIE